MKDLKCFKDVKNEVMSSYSATGGKDNWMVCENSNKTMYKWEHNSLQDHN